MMRYTAFSTEKILRYLPAPVSGLEAFLCHVRTPRNECIKTFSDTADFYFEIVPFMFFELPLNFLAQPNEMHVCKLIICVTTQVAAKQCSS